MGIPPGISVPDASRRDGRPDRVADRPAGRSVRDSPADSTQDWPADSPARIYLPESQLAQLDP